jgi:uncharacterized protein (TIGR02597 family)
VNPITHSSLAVTVALALAAASVAFAQNATTTPVGVVTLEVKAKPASTRSMNFLSLPLVRPAVFTGLIPAGGISTSNGRTVLTFPENSFTGNLSASTAPHYLEISTGDYAGLTSQIIGNTDSTLTLADDLSQVLEAGTTFVSVRPNWTLGTAFPNGEGFQKGTTASNSDNLILFDPDTGAQRIYFYSSSANEWRSGTSSSNNVIIPPDAGIWIERKSTVNGFSIQLSGEVKTIQSPIYVGGSAAIKRTIAPNLYPIDSVTLGSSGLYTGDPNTGLAGGSTASNSDNIIIFDPSTGAQTTYYYNTTFGEWRTGLTPSNSVKIPASSSVLIIRKANRPPFVWYAPRPPMALN